MATWFRNHCKGMRRPSRSARIFTKRRVNRRSQRIIDPTSRSTFEGSDAVGPGRKTAITRLFTWRQESRIGECGCALRNTSLEFANRSDAYIERLIERSEFDFLFTRRTPARCGGQRPFESSNQTVGSRNRRLARAGKVEAANCRSRVASRW